MKKDKELVLEENLVKELKGTTLCWKECKGFKLNANDNCPIYNAMLEFDKKYGITSTIWKCETFEKGD